MDALPQVLALSRAGKAAEARTETDALVQSSFNATKDLLQAEIDLNRRNGEKDGAQSQEAYGQTVWGLAIVLVLCSMAGVAASFVVVRSLNHSLRHEVAALAESARQVTGAASQVASSSQSLAQGSSQQAASLEESSASTEEIHSMARRNNENSRGAAGLVTESQRKIAQTDESLSQMVVAMEEIKNSSGKISKIIKVIDEIAFQTNILALNAAVEAARAGEAGMGFAVVADEVRNLAQRSAQAARDTTALIEESIAASNQGKLKVDEVATAIRSITGESAQIKIRVDEVSMGSEEQSRGIEQIVKAIAEKERVTQTSAASAEESASAAQELSAQAETLMRVVDSLTAMVSGAQASAGRPAWQSRATGGKPVATAAKAAFPLDDRDREF